MKIEHLNATFQPAKIGHPHGLQVTYLKDNSTRNIFIYHEDGKVGIAGWAGGGETVHGTLGGALMQPCPLCCSHLCLGRRIAQATLEPAPSCGWNSEVTLFNVHACERASERACVRA